ncbi:1,4-dihydroxy-2-naphthoyl-CoA hydrolase [Methylobacterium crusticola]|uniref:Medium/long-chain acyl-CoA thioesterase YigI n=1 Tax=Methylobacterium crusticola TaxID=1697972 RepID=A0ABQ4QQD6_9HYPH|nr:PaaI family thioesterase [Methylobacterium crusticola]GJD47459.1 1,4-dihydroxy-2-naphthoyl-CoA hydrolase [Methylobacterium crusticola]
MSPHAPPDPDFAARVRDSFGRQGLMATLGASLSRVEPGLVAIVLPFRPELTQQHGLFHAGATSAIADSAGGYAGFTLFPADSSVLTAEFKINLLAPARGERLVAVGEVVRSGRTLTICDLKVYAEAGGARTLCATGLQTLVCLRDRPDTQTR